MKNWQNNDLVYVTDLNDIVTSANLYFASVAARDAFLVGDLAPRSGMVAAVQGDMTMKRISVGGVDYWAPLPGTMVCTMGMSSNNGMLQGPTPTQVPLTVTRNRNFNTMWANNRFTPTIPGFYELEGGTHQLSTNTDGYRAAWLSLNGTTLATAIPGSFNQMYPQNAAANVTVPIVTRTVCRYFNGTDGSYVTLMSMQNATGGGTLMTNPTAGNSGYDTYFTAKYLGM